MQHNPDLLQPIETTSPQPIIPKHLLWPLVCCISITVTYNAVMDVLIFKMRGLQMPALIIFLQVLASLTRALIYTTAIALPMAIIVSMIQYRQIPYLVRFFRVFLWVTLVVLLAVAFKDTRRYLFMKSVMEKTAQH